MLCLLWGIAMTRRGCADQSAGSAQGLLTWVPSGREVSLLPIVKAAEAAFRLLAAAAS